MWMMKTVIVDMIMKRKKDKDKKTIIYYVTDEKQQSQYINMFKEAGLDALILTHNIDQPFITQLEYRESGYQIPKN